MEKTISELTLRGQVHNWAINGKTRAFSTLTLPFSQTRQFFKVTPYNALTGRGEQRTVIETHAKKLRSAMEEGDYTPTPFAVGLRKKHHESLKIDGNNFELTVKSDNPLSLTDGQHREEALVRRLTELAEQLKSAADDAEKQEIQTKIDEINNLPISVILHLDGDTQADFVKLQEGRPVDKSMIFSMKIRNRVLDGPEYLLAFETAKLLNTNPESPFHNLIKFDSRSIAPLPLTTVCAKSVSDQGTSLIGLAKIGLTTDPAMSAEGLANVVVTTFKALQNSAPAMLEMGKVLAFVGGGGSKGSATMLVGVAVCLAYEMLQHGQTEPSDELINRFIKSVKHTMDVVISGGFSSQQKRTYLANFARDFFKGTKENHEGVPVGLIKTISASAFGVSALPKKTTTTTTTAPVTAA